MSISTYLRCCIVYYFLCGQITFVPHQQLVDVFTGITVYLLQPLFYIIERLLGDKRTVSKTLNQEDSSGLFSNDWERTWSSVLYLSMWFTTTRERTLYFNARVLPWLPQDRRVTGSIQLLSPCSKPYTISPSSLAALPPVIFPCSVSWIVNNFHHLGLLLLL